MFELPFVDARNSLLYLKKCRDRRFGFERPSLGRTCVADEAYDKGLEMTLRFERLNYNSYLKIPELLELQKELSEPPHHDEMFFIIIHQAAELWFKEMLHETEALIEALRANSISRVLKILRRLTGIMDLQVRQINLLSSLTPVEFAGFRDKLRPASGFQSMQFRVLEFAFGLRDEFFLKFFSAMPEALAKLKSWQSRPSVRDEFRDCLLSTPPERAISSSASSRSTRTPARTTTGSCSARRCLTSTRSSRSGGARTFSWSAARSA